MNFGKFLESTRDRSRELFRIWKKVSGDRKDFRTAALKNGFTNDEASLFLKSNGVCGTGKAVALKQDQWWDNPTPERQSKMQRPGM